MGIPGNRRKMMAKFMFWLYLVIAILNFCLGVMGIIVGNQWWIVALNFFVAAWLGAMAWYWRGEF
jgi:hypothetical protein